MNLEVTLFAWKHGIPSLENVGSWNGYQVFAPKYTANSNSGETKAILAKGEEIRFAKNSELASCMS